MPPVTAHHGLAGCGKLPNPTLQGVPVLRHLRYLLPYCFAFASLLALGCTQTQPTLLSPTASPVPTYTPYPTYTPFPTLQPFTPVSSHTTAPTATPALKANIVPTFTPIPTPVATRVTPAPAITFTPTPTSTATPQPTPTNTAMLTPVATATPIPVPTFTPLPTPTFFPTPTRTPIPTPEPDPFKLMLQLTNQIRAEAGLIELEMGDNQAAQIHAEQSLADCISSHWGTDGLVGGMRYSLAGGYQSNQENASGSDFCKSGILGYRTISSLAQEVRVTMEGWMGSPGHRDTILKPRHRKLNIGLAWDDFNFKAIQQFEGDFIEFTVLPNIQDGVLTMEGNTKNGANLDHGDHYRVIILYSPPPNQLTRGQIARAYGTCPAKRVAYLSFKSAGTLERTWEKCLSPYSIDPDIAGPSSRVEARQFWEKARTEYYNVTETLPVTVQKIKMSRFQLTDDRFAVTADISKVLQTNGPGVYEITIWGILDSEQELISEYTIFHGTTPPDTYTPD